MKYWWIIAVVVIFIAYVVVRVVKQSSAVDTKRQNIPLVKMELPRQEKIVYSLTYSGDVSAVQQAGIYSKVTGNLEKLYTDIGQSVKSGQLLALIDTTELEQQLLQASAAFHNARANNERNIGLYKENLASKQDLDNTQATYEIDSANYEDAKLKLDYAHITAPFTGIITKRFFDEGALINANNAILFNLMDLSTVKVVVNVLEKDVSSVRIGMPATLTVDTYPGKSFSGTVRRSSEALDVATRTMAMEIWVPNNDGTLKPGMFATVTVDIGTNENGLTIPTQALINSDAGYSLFTVANGVAKKKMVKIGRELDTRSEVLSGITDSDSVVVVGAQFCRDGGPVSAQR